MKRVLFLLFVTLVATYEVTKKGICGLPPVSGKCRALIPRWYYNIKTGACEPFNYGGCGGNKNNFQTKCDCQKCCGDNTDICCQPAQTGPCRAAITRWYYESKNNTCQPFMYGGCQGNQNNFEEKCQCEQKCLQN